MRALLLALALLAACNKAPPSGTADRRPIGKADPEPDAGAPQACVPACVQRNQMKATSIENIEHDCERECAAAEK